MLQRATHMVARTRERIRAAAERDPHAWPERDDDRAILVRDDVPDAVLDEPSPDGDAPLGSPEPGAPDLDGPLAPGGVSGPPDGGRPHRP
ncbi:MAG TPA: AI-2E family transporter, partial [Geodermatophilus sp.]|nr:AI-2E family transporter [Geodermatophilus sp.]